MAQAGIHGLVGAAVHKWTPGRTLLLLGILLGNLFPDLDNTAVAVATLAGLPTDGLHRTFTHSIFTVAAIIVFFYILARLTNRPNLKNLGVGLGIGVLMHILLDLLIWFNGVEILWPIPSWVNLWQGVSPPEWWSKFMLPVEFLFFALFLGYLWTRAEKSGTDSSYLRTLRIWIVIQATLFVVFTALVYSMEKGFMIPYGALYLLSLGLVIGVTIRMRETVEQL